MKKNIKVFTLICLGILISTSLLLKTFNVNKNSINSLDINKNVEADKYEAKIQNAKVIVENINSKDQFISEEYLDEARNLIFLAVNEINENKSPINKFNTPEFKKMVKLFWSKSKEAKDLYKELPENSNYRRIINLCTK